MNYQLVSAAIHAIVHADKNVSQHHVDIHLLRK